MKRYIVIITAAWLMASLIGSRVSYAYWIWTPESKKFINPKYAVKDSPKEQYEWAMKFYEAGDYKRSAQEFEKLAKHYEFSEFASRAQYHVGLSYENMGKYFLAFQNYQKTVESYPHIDNIEEIIERQFNIANLYVARTGPRIMGADIMTSLDRAIEIYKKVVDNAPYGRFADRAQFNMAVALKKGERYDEAIMAFQKIVDDYPDSQLLDQAKYELAYCAYKASLKPAYDMASTDKAIKAFQDFTESNTDTELSREAGQTIQRLKDKTAEKAFVTAKFYEQQKHYESAMVYYREVVDKHPDSSFAAAARSKLEELNKKVARKGS